MLKPKTLFGYWLTSMFNVEAALVASSEKESYFRVKEKHLKKNLQMKHGQKYQECARRMYIFIPC